MPLPLPRPVRRSARRALAAGAALLAVAPGLPTASCSAQPVAAQSPTPYTKVLLIVEENHTYDQVIGSRDAPYLTALARDYGSAANLVANYPPGCPSLAAYILLTSGTTAGICDDRGPRHHQLDVPNIFAQLDAAHRPWRNYAEDLPAPCADHNSPDGVFLVRHTAVPYYSSERRACATSQAGLPALADDLRTGRLPDYSLVTPNACHDMHAAPPCRTGQVAAGDRWLRTWLPRVLAGPDYRAGRLAVIVTWDEGSTRSNHIPTLVVSPTTRGITSNARFDHCSTLRTTSDILRLPPIGCARTATPLTSAFHL